MKTLSPLKTGDPDWETEDTTEDELPGRPRRRFLTWPTAALMAVIVGAVGFYVGIRVEKSHASGSSALSRAFAFPGAGGGAARAALAAGGSSTGGAPTGGSSATSRSTGAGDAGPPAGLAGFGGAGGGSGSFGTVSSISANTLYLMDASGNTIKVELSSATKISKSVNSSKHSLRPGDTVVVSGLTNKKGTVVATTVRDSGASGTGAGAGSSSSSGGSSGTSGSAAVKSLFGSGG